MFVTSFLYTTLQFPHQYKTTDTQPQTKYIINKSHVCISLKRRILVISTENYQILMSGTSNSETFENFSTIQI